MSFRGTTDEDSGNVDEGAVFGNNSLYLVNTLSDSTVCRNIVVLFVMFICICVCLLYYFVSQKRSLTFLA